MPNFITYLNWTPLYIVLFCQVWLQERIPQRQMFREIRRWPQFMMSILSSKVNIIEGDLYDHFTSMRTFAFIPNKVFRRASKIMRNVARRQFEPANLLALVSYSGGSGLVKNKEKESLYTKHLSSIQHKNSIPRVVLPMCLIRPRAN